MKKSVIIAVVLSALALMPTTALSQAAREATIEPETKARLVLQSHLSSKLNEPGDTVTAVLYEPIYVDGLLVLARGTEFHGRVTEVIPAKRPQKTGKITLLFDRLAMPWGEEPVSILITAIDDWDSNQKLTADTEGKVKGAGNGGKTVENVERGARIGGAGAGIIVLSTGGGPGGLAAGAASLGAGMLGGLLLTKGGEVRVSPGAIFRIKFVKPITLPVIQQPGSAPRPIQQDEAKPPEPPRKP
ncbi:MAG TPA: hypothetical protein VJH03_15995 [Blastocatellia bacterium]|nr:hypothetical protein [Blastocatellia bacterium]